MGTFATLLQKAGAGIRHDPELEKAGSVVFVLED